MKKVKFKIDYLLYVFIVISPFLDVLSFLFREWFPETQISPSTILRPLIPCVLLIYVFFKDKDKRKTLLVMGIIYVIYGGIHLYLYKGLVTGISYGGVVSEAQYLINYTYMIFVLFLYLYFYKKNGLPYLKNSLFIALSCYIVLIYVAILTGTSYTTYLEGMGYRGWFLSGNSVGTILIILLVSLFNDMLTSKRFIKYIVLLLTAIYLVFLLGTRTGLFGFFLCVGVYFGLWFILKLLKDKKVNIKKVIIVLLLLLVLVGFVLSVGTESMMRRKHLKNESDGIIDVNTMEVGHTTGDTGVIVNQIINNNMPEGYMSDAQKQSYLDMYEYANKHEILATDTRKQQLIYHINLIKNQKNIFYILFGNGYLSNYGEMTLEMEVLAILFNFGIVGFILFLLPFMILLVRCGFNILKNKKYNIENMMMLFSVCLAFVLSFMAGYVFFSGSCVLIIICILVMLFKEVEV